MSAFADRRLAAGAGTALVLANMRYWTVIAPLVRAQLDTWEERAGGIDDPTLQALALDKLRDERFNAEVAATLATLAPRAHRPRVVEAIVAYEVMYDYLDGLTEQPTSDPIASGHALYRAFTDAITLNKPPVGDYFTCGRQISDGGYLQELVQVVRGALAQLPSAKSISGACERAATRCAEAQVRAHAAPSVGIPQLEGWASREAAQVSLGWQSFLAGAASSVLAVHALLAAGAAEHTSPAEAVEIDSVYLSICSLSTMLDSLVDYERDTLAGQVGYVRYYETHEELAQDLIAAVRRAFEHAARLGDGGHHIMTLVGVVAYYASAPTAGSEFARPVMQKVCRALEPLIAPTLTVMRAWRTAKRIRQEITSISKRGGALHSQ